MKLDKKLAAVIFTVLAAAAVVLGLSACGSSSGGSAAPAPTQTVTAPAPAPTVTTTAPAPVNNNISVNNNPAPAPAPVPAPRSAPVPPTNLSQYTGCGNGVYAGAATSCPFALNVANGYDPWKADQSSPTGNYARYIYSPVTGQTYWMTYTPSGSWIYATGGNNAAVLFSR